MGPTGAIVAGLKIRDSIDQMVLRQHSWNIQIDTSTSGEGVGSKPSMINTILLDLDDVLNECAGPILSAYGCGTDAVAWYEPEWGYDIHLAARKLASWWTEVPRGDAFWDKFGYEFWANLPQSEWAIPLRLACEHLVGPDNVYIVTSHINSAMQFAGKMTWVQNNLPSGYVDRLIVGKAKHLLAKRNVLLIDDCDKNIDQFRWHGGQGILFPRPWNRSYESSTIPLRVVARRIDFFFRGKRLT